jgi:retron-type reverse transcriptase
MKNSMQLKAIVKNIAKEKKISAQLALQNYMLERFLERGSLSRYRDNYYIVVQTAEKSQSKRHFTNHFKMKVIILLWKS